MNLGASWFVRITKLGITAWNWIYTTSCRLLAMEKSQMSTEPASPLDFLLTEIMKAHNAKLFYAAICLALTVPDVCSAVEFEDQKMRFKFIGPRYRSWCDSWVKCFAHLTTDDLWALRGGVIHKGQTFGHPNDRFERVVFILSRGG